MRVRNIPIQSSSPGSITWYHFQFSRKRVFLFHFSIIIYTDHPLITSLLLILWPTLSPLNPSFVFSTDSLPSLGLLLPMEEFKTSTQHENINSQLNANVLHIPFKAWGACLYSEAWMWLRKFLGDLGSATHRWSLFPRPSCRDYCENSRPSIWTRSTLGAETGELVSPVALYVYKVDTKHLHHSCQRAIFMTASIFMTAFHFVLHLFLLISWVPNAMLFTSSKATTRLKIAHLALYKQFVQTSPPSSFATVFIGA